jgi:hypothetical protein
MLVECHNVRIPGVHAVLPDYDAKLRLITEAASRGAQVCTQQNEAIFCISLQIIAFSCIAVSKQIEAF